jgi:hypothetical protein
LWRGLAAAKGLKPATRAICLLARIKPSYQHWWKAELGVTSINHPTGMGFSWAAPLWRQPGGRRQTSADTQPPGKLEQVLGLQVGGLINHLVPAVASGSWQQLHERHGRHGRQVQRWQHTFGEECKPTGEVPTDPSQ